MKEKFRLKNLVFTLLVLITGVIIGGVVGVTATTNKLEAKYVMYTKDGVTMTVQDAIKDLYVKTKNGSNQTLTLGTATTNGLTITVPYTGTYPTISCVYGIDENYGSRGTISGNTCTFKGANQNTTYYYKIIGLDNNGKIYENKGNITTPSCVSTSNLETCDIPTGAKAIVYLDPTDLSKSCTASNSTVGTGTSGCMKWYAFKEDSTSYTMILDHNTTATVAWNSSNVNTSMKEVQTELDNLVSKTKWKVTPRLISKQEVINIVGNAGYFDTNCNSSGKCGTGENEYYWLFDYTRSCTDYGCKVADSSTYGYWTDTPYDGSKTYVWHVSLSGELYYPTGGASRTGVFGVRPVITVSKSNL